METPSSTRKSTSSMASKNFPTAVGRAERSLSRFSGNGKPDRSPLLDITNDSPIVGLAMANLESPASMAKNCGRARQTPGSGEDLLRGQVKTLLQKIEEEGVELRNPLDARPPSLFLGLADSPALRLLAPTPANTPLTVNLSDGGAVVDVEKKDAPEIIPVLSAIQPKQEGMALYCTESPLTRALLFDSPGKSDISESSVLCSEITCEGSLKSVDEDGSSVWSMQANASTDDYEDEDGIEDNEWEVIEDGFEEEEDAKDEISEEGDHNGIDELCTGLSGIFAQQQKRLPEFEGRHTRFTYDSDDEIEGEEEVGAFVSPSVLRLKGLPTPKGKHLRFPGQEEEEEEEHHEAL